MTTEANKNETGLQARHVVLLIDDDDAFRAAQMRILRRMKDANGVSAFSLHEADSGRQAQDLLAGEMRVDCVLLDHDMPGGSGLDWLQALLTIRPNLAVIMVTGRGSEQLAVAAMKRGAADYLVKGSIAPEDLERAIVNAIEKNRLRAVIEDQRRDLLAAERQRVMLESLATACHHMGQPATVITAYLAIMRRMNPDSAMAATIDQCQMAADNLAEVLDRLRAVNEYRATPYCPLTDGSDGGRILDIP